MILIMLMLSYSSLNVEFPVWMWILVGTFTFLGIIVEAQK